MILEYDKNYLLVFEPEEESFSFSDEEEADFVFLVEQLIVYLLN